MFETEISDDVLQFARPGTRWLSTSWTGGYCTADAAYNVTVPNGFERTDLETYARERRDRAGFIPGGPTLLTGVGMQHARGARLGPVICVATAGISNPAALPMTAEPVNDAGDEVSTGTDTDSETQTDSESGLSLGPGTGTVNLLLGTTRSLDDGALAGMLATAVEAKTATLLDRTGYPGTTTDAVVVGCDPEGESSPFAGSGTGVGSATRACVREAVASSLDSRYADAETPASVDDAEYGTRTTERATVFTPWE